METRRSYVPSSSTTKNSQLVSKKANEGPVYMEFKSYKNKPIPSRLNSISKPIPLSSGETVATRAQQIVELQNELKEQKDKQANLLRSIKKLQTENEQFKIYIDTLITPQTHQQLELQLAQSQQQRDSLQLEIQRLIAANQQQIGIVDDLKKQISDLQQDQDRLSDRIRLEQDAKADLATLQENLTEETRQLQNTIRTLTSDNQSLKDDKQQLQNHLDQLQNRVGEMSRKIDLVGVLQKKLKSHEAQMQQTMQQNKMLSEQNDSCTRLVKVFENDLQTLKSQNSNFIQQNKHLLKQLSGLKKTLERLRQKYDELNKENKILKEKETRYMFHERFNVGKYVHTIPSLFADFGNENITALQHTKQNQNYMRAAKNVKKKKSSKEVTDQRYYLFHRKENIKDNKSDSTEVRKVKK